MKKIFYLALSAAVILMSATSCKKDKKEEGGGTPTGISLSKPALSVEEGSSSTLQVLFTPAGTTAAVTWKSTDETVAIVDNNGKVTGVKKGSTTVTATVSGLTPASCDVTVTEKGTVDPTLHPSLQGSEYFVIFLDETSRAKIASKIVQDLGPDDLTKKLYVWDNSYEFKASDGPNFYGVVKPWTSVSVNSEAGYSGAGIYLSNFEFNGNDKTTTPVAPYTTLKRITDNPGDYYFHVAIKGNATSTSSAFFGLPAGNNVELKFAIGDNFPTNEGTVYSIATLPKDGEWHEYDIKFSDLLNLPGNSTFAYTNSVTDTNLFSFMAGAAAKTLDFDAVFIYKK
ncbi:MAG: Ig-like domain-containing protein [Prevotellaceae bacterium]|jgi:hypothetical protein|nr:Ig-like domain-containing protein [Prevotellaceae bacterium]